MNPNACINKGWSQVICLLAEEDTPAAPCVGSTRPGAQRPANKAAADLEVKYKQIENLPLGMPYFG